MFENRGKGLIEELKERIQELESVNRKLRVDVFGLLITLLDIGTGIRAATEIKPLIDLVLYTLIGKLCIRNVSIALLDEKDKGVFVIAGYKGLLDEESVKELKFDSAGSLSRILSSRGKPMLVTEMEYEEELRMEREKLRRFRYVVALPLMVRDDLRGLLLLGPKISGEPFTSEELDFASILTTQVAATIDNLKLYQELREARDYLEERVKEATRQLKETQAQLIQSAKMAAVGQFGAGVAHELNNPIGGILGYAQFILQKLSRPEFAAEDFKTCRQYVEHIEKESKRCKTIVENLLSFSRRPAVTPAPIDIKRVIEEILSIIGRQLELQNIKVTTDCEPNLPRMSGNVNQLQQVFTNIIINAQHAMPKGGELNIRLKSKMKGGKKNIEINLKDTGCGIPKENLEKIFEPFFTTKQDWKSVGIGLSITYQIVQDHKGTITAESEEGKGTTFTITLPVSSG